VNKSIYKKISSKWKGHVYSTYERVAPRLKAVEPYLKLLKGKNVLEFGCNAGIFAYEIAKYAAAYIGVDKSEYCYKQAKVTEGFIENPNVKFVYGRARDFCSLDKDYDSMLAGYCGGYYNAFVSFYTLYHLHDDEVELLRTHVFPKCDITINMIRTKKRDNAHNDMWKLDKAVAFIKDCGFNTRAKVHNEKFSMIIGAK